MKKIICYVAVLFLVVNCAGRRPEDEEPYYTRIYQGSFDEVWLATLKALTDYPLKLSNKDVGRVQSEVVNGPYNDLLFSYPDPIELPEKYRFSVRLDFAKLVSEDNEPLVRIRIIKEIEKYQDFYTGWIATPSDGLEEKVVLYRIEHILRMDKLLFKQGY